MLENPLHTKHVQKLFHFDTFHTYDQLQQNLFIANFMGP